MSSTDHLRRGGALCPWAIINDADTLEDVLEFVGRLGIVPNGSFKGFTDIERLSSLLERSLAEAKSTDASEPPLLPPLIKHVDKLLSGMVL